MLAANGFIGNRFTHRPPAQHLVHHLANLRLAAFGGDVRVEPGSSGRGSRIIASLPCASAPGDVRDQIASDASGAANGGSDSQPDQSIALVMSSTTFFASPNTIIVLSM